jgi:D-alanine-D-alanine ligase
MDFMLRENGEMFCLEANTLPGMTPTSLLPQEAQAIGVPYGDLCEWLIKISLREE